MRVVHIGLGKVASSSLQNIFFPEVARALDVECTYIGPTDTDEIHKLKLFLVGKLTTQESNNLKEKYSRGNFILSYEGLLSWNPEFWESSIKRLHDLLGEDIQIILFLRKPDEYLRSVYQQAIAIGVNKSPSQYFYCQSRPGLEKSMYHNIGFNIEHFYYKDLVKMLKGQFNDVKVYPMSTLNSIILILEDLGINNNLLEKAIQKKLSAERFNVSYNAASMKLLHQLNKFKKRVGFPNYESYIQYHHKNFSELSIQEKARVFFYRLSRKIRPMDRILRSYSSRSSSSKYELPLSIYGDMPSVLCSMEYFSELDKDIS
jgi:hypothetical protein